MITVKRRRTIFVAVVLIIAAIFIVHFDDNYVAKPPVTDHKTGNPQGGPSHPLAVQALEKLVVKGRAPKTGYAREQFGDGWQSMNGCDTRNIILARDLTGVKVNDACQVVSGILHDPYTAKIINFQRGLATSGAIQIDHVVALSDAWQTGAQQLSFERRVTFANDPLELLAVDGPANQQKGDGDAATWLPPNKHFRCQYIARQIAVKIKYELWVTAAEKQAMQRILATCPSQALPG